MLRKFNVSRGKKKRTKILGFVLSVYVIQNNPDDHGQQITSLLSYFALKRPLKCHIFLSTHFFSIIEAFLLLKFFCLPQDLHLLLSCQVLIWVLRIRISVFEILGCVLAPSSMFAETRSKVTFAEGCKPDISVQL